MKKTLTYIVGSIGILLIIFFSLKVENLQEHQAKAPTTIFDASEYANHFWTEKLPQRIAEAPDANLLLTKLNENPSMAFSTYGKKLGISKTYYFLFQGNGFIQAIHNEYLSVVLNNTQDTLHIATAFIFGNAVRDGSGSVNIDNFINMTDFNNVSIAINKLVKEKIVPRLKKSATIGKQIEFAGVAELRVDQAIPEILSIIPVKANISDEETE